MLTEGASKAPGSASQQQYGPGAGISLSPRQRSTYLQSKDSTSTRDENGSAGT